MTKVIGRLSSIGLGKESTPGTAVAPSYWIPVRSVDFDDKVGMIDNDSAMGRIEELNDSEINQLWADGTYEGKIYLDSVGLELVGLFGQSPTSVQRTTTGVYDHTFALLNNNSHKSLTVGYKDGNQDLRYPYAMVDGWKFEAALDDYVKRTMTLMSKKSATASNTVSHTDEIEFIPDMISVYIEDEQGDLDGGTPIKVTNVQFEVKKNVEANYVLGSKEPDSLNNKQFSVEGSFEAYFESTTQRDYVFTKTQKAMRINMIDEDTIIGSSGSHNPQLYFDFFKAKFSEFSRGWDANDILKYTINFKAVYSIADTALIAARLTNAVASY